MFPHLLEDLFVNLRDSWSNKEKVISVLVECKSKSQFQKDYPGAYNACRVRWPDLLDEVFGKNIRWTQSSIEIVAKECTSYAEFHERFSGAEDAARSRFPGLIRNLFPELRAAWDKEAVRLAAEPYLNRTEFFRNCPGAYKAAHRLNIMDEILPEYLNGADNNAIYIWRAVGQVYNGNPVYKIGVTSARLGVRRIKDVAKGVGFEFEVICCEAVQCKASDLEKKLLILGGDPKFSGFDGCTEFRSLSDSALYAAISLICNQL